MDKDELVANYEQLRQEREWSPEYMGDYIENVDPALAAEYRKAHPASSRGKAPKGRRAAAADEA